MPCFPAGARTRVMLESFAYGDVSLKPGLFKERFDLNRRYLAALDNDSLLYPFRFEAVLPYPGARLGIAPGFHSPTPNALIGRARARVNEATYD